LNVILQTAFEVLILATVYYWFIRHLQQTRGGGLLAGFIILLIVILGGFAVILRRFDLPHLQVIADAALPALSIALLVIFQPELRLLIARIGNTRFVRSLERFFGRDLPMQKERVVNAILSACERMAKSHTGAIIVIQRREAIEGYQTGGQRVNGEVSARLLETIFYEGTPLHDGAVFIIGGRLMWAGCHIEAEPTHDMGFPPEMADQVRDLGTRHAAGFGLAQQCDALVIVVSEETGRISVARQGAIPKLGVGLETLRQEITQGIESQLEAAKTAHGLSEGRDDSATESRPFQVPLDVVEDEARKVDSGAKKL